MNSMFLIILIIISGVSSSSLLLPVVQSKFPYGNIVSPHTNYLNVSNRKIDLNEFQNESHDIGKYNYRIKCVQIEEELNLYPVQFMNDERFDKNVCIENLIQIFLSQ